MSSFKNEIPINAGTAGWIRDCLFLAFFVLSARILWVYLNSVSDLLAWAGFCCILATGVLVWVNTRFVLLAVAASVPLISGIQNSGVMKFAPVIEFCFAAVYVAWYTKNLIQNRGKGRSFTKADLFVDILAGVVIVSLAAQLVVYPFDFLFFRLQQPCVTGLSDRFWCLDSSYILLMGLFYFRLLSMELGQDRSFHRRVRYIIYIQTVIVFMFAGFDFFSRLEGYTLSRIRVALPFGNIHPFGNYVCFLFFFYLGQISFETKQFQLKLRQNSVLMACTLILLALLVLSYSRSTWLAFFIVSGALLFFKLSWKRRIWFVIVISLVFVVIQINGPSFLHSKNRYVKRFARLTVAGHLLEDKTVAGRLMRWKTALEMVGDYPVTGCGIGSFYRLSPHYYTDEEYSDIRSINKGWKKKENVHNYYLQLAAEMGLPGIFFFLAVLFRVYKTGSQRIKEKNNPLDEKKNIKAMLMGVSAFLLTLVPDHSLLLSTHQIMFWFIMAGIAVSGKETGGFGTGSDPDQKSGKKLQGAFVIFLIIMAAGYYHKLHAVEPGPYGYGYYKPERRDGELMRWTMNQSCIEVSAESDYFGFSLYAEPEHFEKGAVHVDLFMDDVLIDTVLLDEKGFAHKYYYMPGIHGRVVRFKLAADSTYNPYKLGVTDNIRHSREQSVAVTDVQFFQIPLKEAKEVKP